jgi:hypothetical protein
MGIQIKFRSNTNQFLGGSTTVHSTVENRSALMLL